MSATILQIERRERPRLSQITSLSDFTCTIDASVDSESLLGNPNISLYCLDHATRQAIFAELPPGNDLSQAPFYHQTQFEHAQRLIAVDYDDFGLLARRVDLDSSRLILIHNIGRCGSTLLSSALNQVSSVTSFSEPDVFSQAVVLRDHDRADLIDLLRRCVRLTFRPAVTGSTSTYSLKFRNQCVEVMDVYQAAFPQAKHLFLYRGGLSYVASLYRLSSRNPRPPISREEALIRQAVYYNRPPASVERFFDPALESCSFELMLATGWLIMLDRYLELYAAGFRPLAVRYEDLNAQPERVLQAMFDFCGLPQAEIPRALEAFARDSQQHTPFARDEAHSGNTVVLPDDLAAQLQAIFARHPVIRSSDFVLPGTLKVD
ncbi:MAG TPA: sulfotransferase domain-containing protein [Phototrophicaceae bacterium]|nr:sulfotransferase domain-containing protein [Phototrophicaceae bacterium]